MLNVHPDKRARAGDLLKNTWVRDVIVKGEEELALRESELAAAIKSNEQDAFLLREEANRISPSNQDALKPAINTTKQLPYATKKKSPTKPVIPLGTPPNQPAKKSTPASAVTSTPPDSNSPHLSDRRTTAALAA